MEETKILKKRKRCGEELIVDHPGWGIEPSKQGFTHSAVD
jgi:hypothetical protein